MGKFWNVIQKSKNSLPPYKISSKNTKTINKNKWRTHKTSIYRYPKNKPNAKKKNRIKTLAGTLEIEGNFLGEEKITAILDGKRVLGTVKELQKFKEL